MLPLASVCLVEALASNVLADISINVKHAKLAISYYYRQRLLLVPAIIYTVHKNTGLILSLNPALSVTLIALNALATATLNAKPVKLVSCLKETQLVLTLVQQVNLLLNKMLLVIV